MGHSYDGGYFAPELKYAGYDKIVIQRQGPRPGLSYISITTGWKYAMPPIFGEKAATETGDLIKQELKDKQSAGGGYWPGR